MLVSLVLGECVELKEDAAEAIYYKYPSETHAYKNLLLEWLLNNGYDHIGDPDQALMVFSESYDDILELLEHPDNGTHV